MVMMNLPLDSDLMWVVNSLRGCHTTHSRLLSRLGQLTRRGFASNPSLNAGPNDAHVYCRELVRKHDYESFLISYFYPSYARRGYFAVKAFSVGNSIQFLTLKLIHR